MISILSIGIAIGLLVSLFIGPISIVCIRRSIADGFLIGFFSGIGAGLADVLYGGIAAFGLTVVADFLLAHHLILRILGGIYLLYLGVALLRNRTIKPDTKLSARMNIMSAFSSTFLLTLSNPITIVTFAAIYTLFDIPELTITTASLLLVGIFAGSSLWWLIIASLGSFLGARLHTNKVALINAIAGIIILLFGIGIFISLYFIR